MIEKRHLTAGQMTERTTVQPAIEVEHKKIIRQAELATVGISVKSKKTGTYFDNFNSGLGVHIGNGFILTTHHLYGAIGQPSFSTRDVKGTDRNAVETYSNDLYDLGILHIDNFENLSSVELAQEELARGQTALVVTPRSLLADRHFDLEQSSQRGRVEGRVNDLGYNLVNGSFDPILLQGILLREGFSGSGVFNIYGELVGLVHASTNRDYFHALISTLRALREVLASAC